MNESEFWEEYELDKSIEAAEAEVNETRQRLLALPWDDPIWGKIEKLLEDA